MKEFVISAQESGQRLDRVLERYMKNAGRNFIYRMLRKKNITLNGHKAQGSEKVACADVLRFYFSDETWEKMGGLTQEEVRFPTTALSILYEDDHVLLVNKPAGMLSQKASPSDISLVEYILGYLQQGGGYDFSRFRPSVCNRLDRNTSGSVAAGKTSEGLRELSALIAGRQIGKYYRAICSGAMTGSGRLEGRLVKDAHSNRSVILDGSGTEGVPVCCAYRVVRPLLGHTELEIELITGKSHQIRAQFAACGHPLSGDPKYADRSDRERTGAKRQMLHAFRMVFPETDGALSGLSGRTIEAPLPEDYLNVRERLS